MAAVGLTVKTIGIDPIEGITRFTSGSTTLMDGIEIRHGTAEQDHHRMGEGGGLTKK